MHSTRPTSTAQNIFVWQTNPLSNAKIIESICNVDIKCRDRLQYQGRERCMLLFVILWFIGNISRHVCITAQKDIWHITCVVYLYRVYPGNIFLSVQILIHSNSPDRQPSQQDLFFHWTDRDTQFSGVFNCTFVNQSFSISSMEFYHVLLYICESKHKKRLTPLTIVRWQQISAIIVALVWTDWGATQFDDVIISWWRHQMESFSALLALCAGKSPVTCDPRTKASDAELWCFFICARINGWINTREAGNLRRHRALMTSL